MRQQPYRRLLSYYVIFAGAVYLCAIIMSVVVILKNVEQSRNAREDQLVRSTYLLREHVDRIVGNVAWIMDTATEAFLDPNRSRNGLERVLIALGQREEFAFYVTITDENGVSIASSLGTSGIDLKDREHVSRLMAPGAPAIYVGLPRKGARTGLLAINVSRRIIDERGNWRGIVIVAFDPTRVAEFWKALSADKSFVALLMRSDGAVLARSGTTSRGEPRIAISDRALEDHGIIRHAQRVDGVDRILAFLRLSRAPMVVAVGIDNAFFDRERSEWFLLSLLWMSLLTAALCLTGLLLRKFIIAEEERQANQLVEDDRLRTAELIQAAFNNAGVFVLVFDDHCSLRFANLPAKHLLARLATPQRELLASLATEARGDPGAAAPTTSHWMHLIDGSMRTICWSVTSAAWIGPDCFVAMGFDRTEAEHLERMLSHKARLTALGEVAVGIAHEVAQPLTIINFTAKRMEQSLHSDQAHVEGLASIRNAATRAGRILNQIKTFARQNDHAYGAVFDVGECVEVVETLTRPQLEHRGIRLHTAPPSQPAFARGDRHMLEQIILNLVLNAREALSDQAERNEAQWIRIDWKTIGDAVSIRVSDNGPGISKGLQNRVFEPFFTTKKGGTGLGLSLSFSMARQMGGSLTLEPSSEGAMFVVELPKGGGTAEEEGEASPQHSPTGTASEPAM